MSEQPIPGSEPRKLVKMELSQLDQLRKYGEIVADTGQFTMIQKYKPQDSTTNPTLILQASEKPDFKHLIQESVDFGLKNYHAYLSKGKIKKQNPPVVWADLQEDQKDALIDLIFDHLAVSFGCKILKVVPGFVSTEVDAKLSFDSKHTIERAKRIIQLYKHEGADINRILIKVASTWEGIKAGEALKKSKIKCNMTLVFDKIQAIACAQRNLFLISPFVGRILDWNKNQYKKTYDNPADDPGVISVTQIFNYFKKFGHQTVVMGASFRNTGQIKHLCGCDKLTISPKLLGDLQEGHEEVPLQLDAKKAQEMEIDEIQADEVTFRYLMNKNKMATDLLSAGIRKFEQDGDKLKKIIREQVQSAKKAQEKVQEKVQEKAQEKVQEKVGEQKVEDKVPE